MTATADFGARTGSMSVQNLDGFSYSGSGRMFVNGPTQFQGTFAGTRLAGAPTGVTPTMNINGAFMQSSTSPVGEIAGNLVITTPVGQNYLGSGIFAGKRP